MSWFADLSTYGRFIRSFPFVLKQRSTPQDGRRVLRDQLENRERNFLEALRRNVYEHPQSPYLSLLKAAGCQYGDLEAAVRRDGLEPTLGALRAAGVRLTFEQLRGHQPVTLDGQEVWLEGWQLDNPRLTRHFNNVTSGTTGRPSAQPIDLDHRTKNINPVTAAIEEAQGLRDLRRALIRMSSPSTTWITIFTNMAQRGQVAERWWVPDGGNGVRPPIRFRVAQHYIQWVSKAAGSPFPQPQSLDLAEVGRVVDWATTTIAEDGRCAIQCSPSMALRISLEAQHEGVSLSGCTFQISGEPVTRAKVSGIHASGAVTVANYYMTEVGALGFGCTQPHGVNDQHLMLNHLGVIQAPRTVGETEVNAFLLTTLLPTAPRILLNAEIDDYGVIEQRDCGCPLQALGLHTHVRDVRSFRKLVTEGASLIGSEMEHLLEWVLPQRFGGSALDYQLLEEEDERGFTRLALVVDPRIEIADENEVAQALLQGLDRTSLSAALASGLWQSTQSLVIRRQAPRLTGAGKLMTLDLGTRRRAP